jgi:lysophospholipase L1-like esterase
MLLVPVFVLLLLGASLTFAAPPAKEKCMAPAEYLQFDIALPNARASMAERGILTIVALGSSTTQGAGSSKPGSDYPSRLQDELARRFPNIEIRVLNRGIGGQTARDMLDRVDTDVLADHPSLTIWQTGVNDALEEVPIEQFEETLRQGIDVLHGSNVDVILMDMQYYPASARIPYYEDYLKAMRGVAEEKRVTLFRRYDIMKYWVDSGQFHISDEVLLHDQFHLADPSYSCLGSGLADVLEAGSD